MTYRIEVVDAKHEPRLVFLGLLDRAALHVVEVQVRELRALFGVERVDVFLAEGTEIDPECMAPLIGLPGAAVKASSPFLQRWLAARRLGDT